jgi:hypothetical protein
MKAGPPLTRPFFLFAAALSQEQGRCAWSVITAIDRIDRLWRAPDNGAPET